MEEKTKKNKNENKARKEKDEVQVTISNEVEQKLKELIDKASHGFDLAKITRKQLLAHIVEKAIASVDDEEIQAIQRSSISDMTLFDQLCKEVKKSGTVPEVIKEYLWKSHKLTQSPKKSKKNRQSEYSGAIVQNEEVT